MRGERGGRGIRPVDVVRHAHRAVVARPLRTTLTAGGVGFGVAAAVATLVLTLSAAGAVSSQFDALAATRVVVQYPVDDPVVPPHPDGERIARLGQVTGVVSAAFQARALNSPTLTTLPAGVAGSDVGPDRSVSLVAAQPGLGATVGATLVAGRWSDRGYEVRRESVALVDIALCAHLGWPPGQAPGRVLYVNGQAFAVIGVYAAPTGVGYLTSAVVVPYAEAVPAADRSLAEFQPSEAVVRVRPGAAQVVGDQAPTVLAPERPTAPLALVPAQLDTLRAGVQTQTAALFLGLAALSLLVGSLGVATTMFTSVVERRAEIGLQRAVGARRRDVAAQFLLESAGTGAIGGLGGLLVGLTVSIGVCLLQSWVLVADPRLLLAAPVVGALVGAVAGAIPATAAARVEPASSLRSSG